MTRPPSSLTRGSEGARPAPSALGAQGLTGAELMRSGTARLRAAGVPDPLTDTRRLLAYALEVAPERLTLALAEPVGPGAVAAFDRVIARREARQPVAQILGRRAFWGREFRVTPDVLDPRPETETLIELALERPFTRVLDLGTGSGCILLSLLAERSDARGLGVDASEPALAVARGNAVALGVSDRAEFRRSDWWSKVEGRFDLIVANPPYVAEDEWATLAPEVRDWEPRGALTPGGDGLGAYRQIAAGAADHLLPGGAILLEIGAAQGVAVAAILAEVGFSQPAAHRDLGGRDRVISAIRPVRSF